MNNETNIQNRRFAACAAGARLLSLYSRTARRAPVSESGSQFHLSAGCISRDRVPSVSQNSKTYLTRCEIFRGKIPPRKTQNQKQNLESPARLRQHTYE
jgi:hypothetical protein